jgi:hypothetical protein
MIKRIVLWPHSEDWPTWWLLLIALRLSWFGASLTRDALPLVGEMLVAGAIFFVTWPLTLALTRWLRTRLGDDPGGGRTGRRSEGSLGEG